MFSGSCTPMKNLNENTGHRREDLENTGVGDIKPVSAGVVISSVLSFITLQTQTVLKKLFEF